MAVVNGTAGNDSLTGTASADSISGFAGNDTLNGLGAVDTLNGGLGNDTYIVTAGDVLSDSGGVDTVVTDVTWTLGAGFENLTMTGTAAISVTGNELGNFAIGNSGANYFNLRAGNDTIQAGAGNDRIDMSNFGTPSYGDDVIDGGAGFDMVNFANASPPKSAIVVDLAAGTIVGGGEGGVGSASVTSVEQVITGEFNDRLSGSSAAETLDGRGGNDTLSGLGGNDTLIGGTGQDTFVFASAPASGNVDLVTDFVSATDKLTFENGVFTGLGSPGNFSAGDARFAAGAGFTSGRDASDRIVYNTSNGNLYYDADGSGGGASQLIATLQGLPTLTATDITVTGQAQPGPIQGTDGNDSLTGTAGNDSIDGRGGNDSIHGGAGNDTIDGGAGDDTLDGGVGVDLLRGGSGNDTLRNLVRNDMDGPAPGSDTLDGGLGDDLYDLRASPFDPQDTVLLDAGGVDTVLSNHDFVLPAGFENLTLYEGVVGSGNASNNVIVTSTNEPHAYFIDGADGNDTLIGGPDSDRMQGGRGDDRIVVQSSFAWLSDEYDGGEGFDFVDLGGASTSNGWFVDLSEGTLVSGDEPSLFYASLVNIEGVSGSQSSDDQIIGSAARTAPVEEVIRDGDNGLLFDFFSAESLAEKVDEALRRQIELQPLREQARRTIVERYDLKRVCLPAQVGLVGQLKGQGADAGAAANVENLAGDKSGFALGEEHHGARDVVGLA